VSLRSLFSATLDHRTEYDRLVLIPNPVRTIAKRWIMLNANACQEAMDSSFCAEFASSSGTATTDVARNITYGDVMSITAPMPFWSAARIIVSSVSQETIAIQYAVEVTSKTAYKKDDSAYYRVKEAIWNDMSSTKSCHPPILLDVPATEWGHIVRINFETSRHQAWSEADFIFSSDQSNTPFLHDTGAEDYFLYSHRFGYGTPSTFVGHGCMRSLRPDDNRANGRHTDYAEETVAYRDHLIDPISFVGGFQALMERSIIYGCCFAALKDSTTFTFHYYSSSVNRISSSQCNTKYKRPRFQLLITDKIVFQNNNSRTQHSFVATNVNSSHILECHDVKSRFFADQHEGCIWGLVSKSYCSFTKVRSCLI
jgi:hypothetical protein